MRLSRRLGIAMAAMMAMIAMTIISSMRVKPLRMGVPMGLGRGWVGKSRHPPGNPRGALRASAAVDRPGRGERGVGVRAEGRVGTALLGATGVAGGRGRRVHG